MGIKNEERKKLLEAAQKASQSTAKTAAQKVLAKTGAKPSTPNRKATVSAIAKGGVTGNRAKVGLSSLGSARSFEEYSRKRKEQEEAEARNLAAQMLLDQENAKRDANRAIEEQRQKNIGFKNIAGKVVYATPYSPLPKPTTEVKPGMIASKAQAPGAYGIDVQDYVKGMSAIDKYKNLKKPEDAETKAFLDKYFGGKTPTADEFNEKYDSLYNDMSVPDEELSYFYYNGADLVGKAERQQIQYDEERAKLTQGFNEALAMLGVDAEQYATGNAADYYERYRNTYGAERDSKVNPYGLGGMLNVTQEEMERWYANPLSHTTQGEQHDLMRWGQLHQEEKDVYATLLRDHGEEAAKAYLAEMEGELNQRVTESETAKTAEFAMKHPIISSIVSPIERMSGATQFGGMALEELLTGKQPDEYDLRRLPTRTADTVVGNVAHKIEQNVGGFGGNALGFGYQTLMSLADMGANMLAFGVGGSLATGAAMGLGAASSTYNNAIDRGADHATANAMAGVAGIAEMLFEKFSIEGVWKIAQGNGLKTALKNIGRQMGIEASEETMTELANTIADTILMGDLSTLEQEGSAAVAKNIALAAVGGALMGGVSGGGAQLYHNMTSKNTRQENQNEQIPELVETANASVDQAFDERLLEDFEQDAPVQEYREIEAEEAEKAVRTVSVEESKGAESNASNEPENAKNDYVLKAAQNAISLGKDGTNAPVSVTAIDRVEKGKVYVRVTDQTGEERVESTDDVDFSGDMGALMGNENMKRLDARGVQTYVDEYDSTLSSPAQYSKAFMGVYERARAGMDYNDAVVKIETAQRYLTQEAASAAFTAGQRRYNIDNDILTGQNAVFQKRMVNVLNKFAGGKIRLTDRDIGANAMIDTKTGDILVSTKAENGAFAYYALHEMGHKLKAENAEGWSKFQTLVTDAMKKNGIDVDAAKAHIKELYEKQGKQMDDAGYLEEVVCNHAASILQDEAIVKDMISKDRKLMEKVADFLRDFLNKMNQALQHASKDMSKMESWKGMQALKKDHESLEKIYKCLMDGLEQANNQQSQQTKQDVKLSAKEEGYYDYSKPFAEQVEDLHEGRFPEIDALVVSGTPEVLQKIGFSNLPLTINQDHLLRMERDTEHYLSKELIRQLPELLKDPVAVITSEGNSDSSTVMILKAIVNGKPYIAPVYITSESISNNARIDSNNIATVFRKGNAVTKLLENAVQKENAGKIGVYYWKKTEARDLFEGAGVQFSGSSIQDGLVHSIYDAGSPVNVKFMEQTETKQFKRWFGNSQVVNADGSPKVMYRGGGEEINVFDRKKSKASNLYGRGFYFTDSETHAKQYGEARSYYLRIENPLNAGSGEKKITPKQMRAFLEAVAEDEDYGLENYGYGATVDSVLKELKGKADFEALQDINATAIGDFVAAIELFNEVNGTKYDGIITPTETVVFDSRQIKSATNNVGTFDASNPDIRFSLKESVEETRDLLAVHNLTEENMRNAMELGGLAMPSIAVIKAEQGHSMYGTISVIFDKSTIDPKASSANEIYGGDAWTPTFPQVEYEADSKAEDRIRDKYYELEPKVGNQTARALYRYATDLEEEMNRNGGVSEIIKKLEGNTDMMQMYLADNGWEKPEPVKKTIIKRTPKHQAEQYDSLIQKMGEDVMRSFETPEGEKVGDHRRAWMDEHYEALKQAYVEVMADATGLPEENVAVLADNRQNVRRMLLDAYNYMKTGGETREEVMDYEATEKAIRDEVDEEAYKKWLNELFEGAEKRKGIRNQTGMYTPSGNRRSFSATHWDVTLDNVVRAMRSEEKTGVGSIGGRNIEGAAVKKYSSIKDVKADSGRLQTIDQDEYDAMRKEFRDRFSAIAREYAGDGDWFDAGDVLVEAVTKHQTADGIYKYISKHADWFKPSRKIADDLFALVEEMKNAPTGYFEAKPRRAVGFDEMAAVIVPDNLSDDVRTGLENAGATLIEYEAGNEADRLDKMNGEAVSKLKFSLRETDENVQESLSMAEEIFTATHGHRMTMKEARQMAKNVIKAASSTMKVDTLAQKIMHLYDYVERGENVSQEAFDTMVNALAEEVWATSKVLDTVHEERMQPIRDYFRTTRIALSDQQRREAAGIADNFGTYRRMVFGRVKLTTDGLALEKAWGELNQLDAELFPADASETEMVALLLDAVDAMNPVYQNESGMNAMEAAQWLAGEMNCAYFALEGVGETISEMVDLKLTVKQYREVMDRFQKEHKAKFNEAMAKVRADMDEEKAELMRQADEQRRVDKLYAQADAEARAREEIAEVKAKTAQEMEAYREALKLKDKEWRQNYRANAEETGRKQRYRKQITQEVNKIVKLLEHPNDKKHVLDGLQEAVLEFCQSIELGGKNQLTRSLKDRINTLAKAMENAQKGTESGTSQYIIDPDLMENMSILAEEVKALGSMNDLTADQMRDMRDIVKSVAHTITMADQMFAAEKGAKISDAATSSMDEMSRKKDKKQREGMLGKVDELLNNGMLDSFRFFDRLGTSGRKMFQALRDGFDVKVRCISEANDYVQKNVQGIDKNALKGKKAKKATYKVTGGEIELTKAQVMELYCLSKREAAAKHLYNGGITTDDHVKMAKVTEADVQNIAGTLTETERKVADALQRFLEKECAKWGNETSNRMYGYSKYGEEHYYPMRVDDGSIDTKVTEKGQTENLWALVHPGFSKELSDKANQPLRIGDIFDTFSRHVDSMSNYRAYAAPIADLLRWYNWKPYGEQGIKTMLTQKFGVNGREFIPTLIRDLNGQNKAGYTPGIMESMTRNAKAAAVGANIRVVIQQPTAIARAAAMMSPKYIAEGAAMTPKRMKRCGELAKQYCPIAKWKSMGYYETHMGKGLRNLMFGGQDLLNEASDFFMKPAGWADEMTWAALWNACEKETKAMHPELSGEALYKETGKRLGEIIDYTQVVDTPFHRSQLMRSKNTGVQMATAFMSEPTKTYNMLQAAVARWAENRRDPVANRQLGRTLLVFVATGVLNAAAQSVIDAIRDDDDEEELLEKYMQAFGGNVIDNVNPLQIVPYVSDIVSIVQGYEPSRMDMQMVQKVYEIVGELSSIMKGEGSKWSVHKWNRKVLSAVSYATGVPLENLYRDGTSLYNTAVMQFDRKPLSNLHETATTTIAYENMYDALMKGNQKTWSRIEGKLKGNAESPKSNSDIDTGIGKLLSEDDERIAQAWEAKEAGKANEVSRIRKEMVSELAEGGILGTTRLNEIVDKAINTYGNKVSPKEEEPFDTEKQLKVRMYTQDDMVKAVRGVADGTVSLTDAKAIMSEVVADSEAKDPEKSVRSNVLGEVKKDYLAAVKGGNTKKATALGNVMQNLLGAQKADMDKWVTDSYAEDLRTAVDSYSASKAKTVMAKLRARGLDDYDIKDRLQKYRQLYIDAMKRGDRTTANKIKSTLMGLGLTYKDGDPMYTESTFTGWMQ